MKSPAVYLEQFRLHSLSKAIFLLEHNYCILDAIVLNSLSRVRERPQFSLRNFSRGDSKYVLPYISEPFQRSFPRDEMTTCRRKLLSLGCQANPGVPW